MFSSLAPLGASRRGFIRKFLAASSAILTLGATRRVVANAAEPVETASVPAQQGYRETAHVRAYYRAARF